MAPYREAAMIKFLSCSVVATLLICPPIYGNDCAILMASLGELANQSNSAEKNTHIYLTLLKHLTNEKNALSSKALSRMSLENLLPDPMKYISDNLSAEDQYSFSKAFGSLKDVNWDTVRD